MKENMTALISSFVRCYHYKNNKIKIFNDSVAEKILTKNEYNMISSNMIKGINFFNSNFRGTDLEALKWIVDNQLSPSVLGRSAFCEKTLENEIKLGCKEYLIFASGYDTFAYRNKYQNLKIYEIDMPNMIDDKINRLNKANIPIDKVNYIKCDFTNKNWIDNIINSSYNKDIKSFSSLMGISYYLSKDDFINMIEKIARIISIGSGIIFDYPTEDESKETSLNEKMAKAANEQMKSKYTYKEIEEILENNNLYVYKHLDNIAMTNQYFYDYNNLNQKNNIVAPKGVNYCYVVKK